LCTPAIATAYVLLLLPLLHTKTQHPGRMLQGCLALLLLLLPQQVAVLAVKLLLL
jgi:hypothetical protein